MHILITTENELKGHQCEIQSLFSENDEQQFEIAQLATQDEQQQIKINQLSSQNEQQQILLDEQKNKTNQLASQISRLLDLETKRPGSLWFDAFKYVEFVFH